MANKAAKNETPTDAAGTSSADRIPTYAWISLAAFLCCSAILVLLIVTADILSRFGLLEPVYYLVVVPMSLTAAVFLFGVLNSSATWDGRFLGGALKLSGPVVGAALVVVGGYYFFPKATSFQLTVYVHADGGPQDIVLRNTGHVVLKLGQEPREEPIGESGQAVFPRIPAEFRGQQVTGWIESDDYEASNTEVTLACAMAGCTTASINVDMIVKKKIKHFELAGTVLDEHGNSLPNVRIALPAYRMEAMTNSDGRFDFHFIADRQQTVDLTAEKHGYETLRLSPMLGDTGVKFSLKAAHNVAH